MTADHYAYVAASRTALFAARNPVPAGAVKIGAFIWRASGDAVVPERVTSVDHITAVGIINPFTMHGGRQGSTSFVTLALPSFEGQAALARLK